MSKNTQPELESRITVALLNEIDSCNDPVGMFKAQERLRLFNEARLAGAKADYYRSMAGAMGVPEGNFE